MTTRSLPPRSSGRRTLALATLLLACSSSDEASNETKPPAGQAGKSGSAGSGAAGKGGSQSFPSAGQGGAAGPGGLSGSSGVSALAGAAGAAGLAGSGAGASPGGQAGQGGAAGASVTAPQGPSQLVHHEAVADALDVKFPSLARQGDQIVLVGHVGEQACAWARPLTGKSFGARQALGVSRGQSDYAAATVHEAPGGELLALWIDQAETKKAPLRPSVFFAARKPAGGPWGAAQSISQKDTFRPFLDFTVTTSATFVFWDEDERVRFIQAPAGGTFGPEAPTVDQPPGTYPAAVALPDGRPAYAVAVDAVHVATFNGATFDRTQLPKVAPEHYYASISLTVGPDGRLRAGFREVGPGVYLAEQGPDGAWSVNRVFDEQAFGRVAAVADPLGGLHLLWAHGEGSTPGLRHAYRPPGGAFHPPAIAPIQNFHNGAWAVVTVTDRLRVHAVTEDFADGGMKTHHAIFEVTP